MCFHSQQSKSPEEIAKRYRIPEANIPKDVTGVFNAFEFPNTPIIRNDSANFVTLAHWGLIPYWAQTSEIKSKTPNARIETVEQKPAFRDSIAQRCLVLADAFFEWQWRDSKGKNKQKYKIHLPENALFSFAGLWSEWVNPVNGITYQSYTILTTEANPLMAEIHNTKKRMPVILPPKLEEDWLNEMSIQDFRDLDVDLVAEKVGYLPTLFD